MLKRLVVFCAAVTLVIGLIACSGDDDNGDDGGSNVDDGPSPQLEGPASRFAPAEGEVADYLSVFPPETYELSAELFAFQGPFADPNEAEEFLRSQGYGDGYRVQFHPDGLLAGVVGGGQYYLTVETYLFATAEGARTVYQRFEELYADIEGSERRDVDRVGNRVSGWEFVEGPIGDTEHVGVYHRVVFQRGNLIGVIQTFGAEEEMNVDTARELAELIDERALGETPAVEPTPVDDEEMPAVEGGQQ